MIDLYTWTTPNGRKASIMLEEIGLPYTVHPVDIGKDEQFKPEFLEISPNNRIPAIVDRDTGMTLMESGALMIYLADKTGKLLPKEGEPRYRVLEWLMWQMGGPGPMFGQVHHFVKYNKGKAPYAEERYLKEAHRLYGVLDRRLAGARLCCRRIFHRRHRDLAMGLALRMADHRSQAISAREALVHGHCRAAGGAEGLQGAKGRRRYPPGRLNLMPSCRGLPPAAPCPETRSEQLCSIFEQPRLMREMKLFRLVGAKLAARIGRARGYPDHRARERCEQWPARSTR